MSAQVRILIVGSGRMGTTHAANFAAMDGVEVAGVVDRDTEAAGHLARQLDIPHRFASVEAALEALDFDAAANATPDAAHYPTSLPLLAAGKHVLCEKPLAASAADARRMAQAADRAGVVHMVNLTYRAVPPMQADARMLQQGEIGKVRHFEASYLKSWLTQPLWGDWRTDPAWLWRLSRSHGSKGVLGDVGIHILDFATHVAGDAVADVSCRLKTYDKAPGGRIGDYRLDANDGCAMHVSLRGGAIGSVTATRLASGHINDLFLRIHGDEGGLDVSAVQQKSLLRACLGPDMASARWIEVETAPVPTNSSRFIAAIRGAAPADPDFHRGAALQAVLDAAEASDAADARRVPVG